MQNLLFQKNPQGSSEQSVNKTNFQFSINTQLCHKLNVKNTRNIENYIKKKER